MHHSLWWIIILIEKISKEKKIFYFILIFKNSIMYQDPHLKLISPPLSLIKWSMVILAIRLLIIQMTINCVLRGSIRCFPIIRIGKDLTLREMEEKVSKLACFVHISIEEL